MRRGGGVGGWQRENDQHWFILDVLLSGWCRQNTSLHPIPSHYLPAITAVQRVSYRVINTSPRPHTASTSSSRRRLMTAKDRQCILSLVTAVLLSVHTHFTVAEERIPTPREASSAVSPQTLHLKWYIKATCLKILHMIDVSNDSVFSVWKSHVCFSPHFRSPGKENATAATRDKVTKKGERERCQSLAHMVTEIRNEPNSPNTRRWEGDNLSETLTQINYFDVLVIWIN